MVYVAAVLCIAEILTMTGVATYAALLPVLRAEWNATNTLAGVISGAFFAGYMPAVKELSERTSGPRQGRAIAFYTSSFGLGTSLSLWLAGAIHSHLGWRAAFLAGAAGPMLAAALVLAALPARRAADPASSRRGLFRLVLRDRRI